MIFLQPRLLQHDSAKVKEGYYIYDKKQINKFIKSLSNYTSKKLTDNSGYGAYTLYVF